MTRRSGDHHDREPATPGIAQAAAAQIRDRSRVLWCAGRGISVIEGATSTITATLPEVTPDIAVDPVTNTIYIASRSNGSPTVHAYLSSPGKAG
jgi:hypothetical protein